MACSFWGFIHSSRPGLVKTPVFRERRTAAASLLNANPNESADFSDESTTLPPIAAAGDVAGGLEFAEPDENDTDVIDSKDDDDISAVVGVSGLIAGGATVATTVATTAGGVCVGGGCAAGAGAAAAAAGAGTTGATAAAAAGGAGFLAGAKALLAGVVLAASVAFGGGGFASGTGGVGGGDLEAMVRTSTPIEVAVQNGMPTVMEFYGNGCPHCHDAARRLRPLEDDFTRQRGLVNWVMVNTDDPRTEPLWRSYRVDELPHFEFLDREGHEVGVEVGEVDAQHVADRVEQLATQ